MAHTHTQTPPSPLCHGPPQVTAELQKLEAQRASAAGGTAPLRGELRALEARAEEAAKRGTAKRALLDRIGEELGNLQVGPCCCAA